MFYQNNKGNPLDAQIALVEKLRARAKRELRVHDNDIIIRQLRPEDVGFSNPVFMSTIAASATAAWSNMINTYTIGDNRFVGIFGVSYDNNENNIVALRITREGKTTREWSIQQIADFEDKTGYADDPITIDQNTQITIEKFAVTTTSRDTTTLLGVVAERRGLLINP